MPFEVPSSWEWTTLGAISNYGENKNVQIENIEAEEWILELEDIEKDSAKIIQYLSKNERKINGTRHKFCKGEILYSKLRTYLNKVLIAPNNGYCTTEIMPFVTFGLSNEYVCHVLRSPYFLDYTQQCGYGVKMPRLSTTDACNGMIPLPPLAEQYRIISEIEKWFAFIDIIESGKTDLQTTIKQTKCKILDLAIHGKLVPQDPSDEPASELLKRINPKAELTCDNGQYGKVTFEIPYNWCWQRLGDINDIARGGSPRPIKDYLTDDEDGVNWIKIGDTSKDEKYINSVKEKIRVEGVKKSRMVHKGDFLLTNSMSFGRPYILNVDGCIHDGWLVISPKGNAYNADFLYYLLSSTFAYDQFAEVASGGVVTNLNSDKVADTMFPLPPLPEQYRIVAKIEELFTSLDNIQKALEV